jgi:hypothetical protein
MELTDGETFVGLAVGFTYPHGSEGVSFKAECFLT